MSRPGLVLLRVIGALLATAVTSSVVYSSAATLGGLQTGTLGVSTGGSQHVTSVQIAWNPGSSDSTRPLGVRLTADAGEVFEVDDRVDVTAAGAGSATCTGGAAVPSRTTVVDVAFPPTCGIMLWELQGVAVNVSGSGAATAIRSTMGAVHGSLSSFDGAVVHPDAPVESGYTTSGKGLSETLATLRLTVGDATAEQLVGRRLMAVLSRNAGQPTTHSGTVGTSASNRGIWVENDPGTGKPVVIADLGILTGGQAPRITDASQYRLVLLQPQRLGGGQMTDNQHAVISADGVIEGTGGGGGVDVSSAVEPVSLDDRLKVKGRYSQAQDDVSLRFCYEFEIKNTTKQPVEWQLTFDTTQPPMWGLNPENVRDGAAGALHNKWGFDTVSYQQNSGQWTIGGVNWNKVLAPQASTTVGYCARPEVPAMDTTRFDPPEISLKSGNKPEYVEFRIKVKSSFEYLVPWEAEVDFADYVCPASLPRTLNGQNSVLTLIEGTRYRVRGTDNTYRFVSKGNKQDYVFLGFRPVSDPFDPTCAGGRRTVGAAEQRPAPGIAVEPLPPVVQEEPVPPVTEEPLAPVEEEPAVVPPEEPLAPVEEEPAAVPSEEPLAPVEEEPAAASSGEPPDPLPQAQSLTTVEESSIPDVEDDLLPGVEAVPPSAAQQRQSAEVSEK